MNKPKRLKRGPEVDLSVEDAKYIGCICPMTASSKVGIYSFACPVHTAPATEFELKEAAEKRREVKNG